MQIKTKLFLLLGVLSTFLSGCMMMPIRSYLLLRPSDMVYYPIIYILLSFVMAFLIYRSFQPKMSAIFWGALILNLMFSPFLGIIILMCLFVRKFIK